MLTLVTPLLDDPLELTGHFLTGTSMVTVPEHDRLNVSNNRLLSVSFNYTVDIAKTMDFTDIPRY